MISRTTAKVIAEAYEKLFTYSGRSGFTVSSDQFYDFLFENDYESWFCNCVKQLYGQRAVKELVMRLHTGETQRAATPNWSSEQRKTLGQVYLRNLAEDMIHVLERNILDARGQSYYEQQIPDFEKTISAIVAQLELDGLVYKDGRLLENEADVLDVVEERGVVITLAASLGLPRLDIMKDALQLSEAHYLESRWADSISNSRKALECLLADAATIYAGHRNIPLSDEKKEKPVLMREFLKEHGLLEEKEKEAVAKIYGLLSHTGSHPYMAEKDQARLLRQLSLTLAQFVLLRLEGAL